jgi:hypothetical protein
LWPSRAKLKRQWTLSREEAAGWLSILADSLGRRRDD